MKEKFCDRQNRRARRAARQRDYVKASYYEADHLRRLGLRSWVIVTTLRRPLDLGRPDNGKEAR